MKIVFAGQAELTDRIQALSSLLAAAGHSVTVFTSGRTISNLGGIHLQHVASVSPQASGGWLYTLLCLFRTGWQRPRVVHIHGWKMASLAVLLSAFLPDAMIVWTVDHLPRRGRLLTKWTARQAAYLVDAVTVPRRDIQWQLLQISGVRAEYIPDGYHEDSVPLISPRHYGLWAKRYCLATAQTREELTWIAQAYRASRSRKKLVVLSPRVEQLKSLTRTYPFLHLIETDRPRVTASLMSQAAMILLGSRYDRSETLLLAMNATRPVISITHPLHEETLGVTAAYVQEQDGKRLTTLLKSTVKGSPAVRAQRGRAAKRAYLHFRWERVFLDYVRLYQPAVFLVPLDSAQGVKFTQPVVH